MTLTFEALAVEEYARAGLSDLQLRDLLNIPRLEADRILKNHEVRLDYTVEDFDRESGDCSVKQAPESA